ncbi:hypothetical protein IID62_09760 [candidate division KSB1 bacterium]|nr:hypothetical protein [candidate division KSB1 bacterium]
MLKNELDFVDPSGDDVLKYRLWQESGNLCLYTGKRIALNELFTGEYEIEHIIPYKRSLDNSFFNKTICQRAENVKKGDKTPFEAYSGNEQKYSEILRRVRK